MLQANINLINAQTAAQYFANDIVAATSDIIDQRAKAEKKWSERFDETEYSRKWSATLLKRSELGRELLAKDVTAMNDADLAAHFRAVSDEMENNIAWNEKNRVSATRAAVKYVGLANALEAPVDALKNLEDKQKATLEKLADQTDDFVEQYGDPEKEVNGDDDPKLISYVVDNLPSLDSRYLRHAYKATNPDLDLVQEFECADCGHEQDMEVPLTADFFWPDR